MQREQQQQQQQQPGPQTGQPQHSPNQQMVGPRPPVPCNVPQVQVPQNGSQQKVRITERALKKKDQFMLKY